MTRRQCTRNDGHATRYDTAQEDGHTTVTILMSGESQTFPAVGHRTGIVPLREVESDRLLAVAVTSGLCGDDRAAEGACPARLQTLADTYVAVSVATGVPVRRSIHAQSTGRVRKTYETGCDLIFKQIPHSW
jgi:hypothetical protein